MALEGWDLDEAGKLDVCGVREWTTATCAGGMAGAVRLVLNVAEEDPRKSVQLVMHPVQIAHLIRDLLQLVDACGVQLAERPGGAPN